MIFEDQLAALEADSKKVGTQGGELDFALLVDGLAAEREQGITIDVAYRYFSTDRRKFIVADTPGHEQYTRNMVTGASTADVAVILIDARKGVLTQTRRHSYIVSLLGIRHVVLAINKMDLVGYSQKTFDDIVADYREFAQQIGLDEHRPPCRCRRCAATTCSSAALRMPWYEGPTLMELSRDRRDRGRPADQAVPPAGAVGEPPEPGLPRLRRHDRQRQGSPRRRGARVAVGPAEHASRASSTTSGDLDNAVAGQSVTLTLADEIDVSRGDVLAAADSPPAVADQFEATIIWMHDEPMLPGRPYLHQDRHAHASPAASRRRSTR